MADMARTTRENSINIQPTLYKNQGEIINLVSGSGHRFFKYLHTEDQTMIIKYRLLIRAEFSTLWCFSVNAIYCHLK